MVRTFTGACLLFLLATGTLPNNEVAPLWVRLQTPVSTKHSEPGNSIEAVVVQPFTSPANLFIPVGTRLSGKVVEVSSKRPATLRISFDSVALAGRTVPFKTHVLQVDNARERVAADGTIIGLDELRKRPGKVEVLLLLAAHAHPAVLASLETSKFVLREVDHPEVSYSPGTDLALAIDEYPKIAPRPPSGQEEVATSRPLTRLLTELPQRTQAKHPPVPSDWVNLALIGSRESLEQAFHAAGWQTAAELSLRTEAKTFFAVADHHAYRQAPVSTLLLFGREPDMVYRKQTNTFAKRHHIRIWSASKTWKNQALWIAAATHDVGIDFSEKAKTFTHRVDPDIDLERTKVVSDLRFAGCVESVSFMPRSLPDTSFNATGDAIHTDGRVAVLDLLD